LPGAADSKTTAIDSLNVALDSAVAVDTPEGFVKWEQVTIAKEMVQDYDGIPTYKPAKELERILDHGENRPVTDEHPPNLIVDSNSQRKGYIENLTFTDASELNADVILTDSTVIKKVKSGDVREVSIGFHTDVVDEKGTFNGVQYDRVQTDILLDHLAMTKTGRCSLKDGCGIKKDAEPAIKDSVATDEHGNIKLANEIIADHRIELIADISATRTEIDRDTLDAMSLDELKRMKSILDTGTVTTIKPNADPLKSIVDDAYNNIGGI